MKIKFEKLETKHKTAMMEIHNYYTEIGTAAFPEFPMPEQFFEMLIQRIEDYPSYAVINEETLEMAGFCMLSEYHPFSTFKKTAVITYFISEKFTGTGIGSQCLEKLESDAVNMGIKQIIADVSSENQGSIKFHARHGFEMCGTLKGVGNKLGRDFDIVLMQKQIG